MVIVENVPINICLRVKLGITTPLGKLLLVLQKENFVIIKSKLRDW